MSANGDIELICLKDKYDPCPFKRKRKDRQKVLHLHQTVHDQIPTLRVGGVPTERRKK